MKKSKTGRKRIKYLFGMKLPKMDWSGLTSDKYLGSEYKKKSNNK